MHPILPREQSRAIEADCAQVLTAFFTYLDERRHDEQAALFAEDGLWHRRGAALKGPEGVRSAMAQRSPTVRTRHVLSNILVTVTGAETAEFMLYLTLFSHDDGKNGDGPATMPGASMLFVVPGRMAWSLKGWRIVEMTMRREFEIT